MQSRTEIIASEFCSSVRDGTHDSPKEVLSGGKPLVTTKHLKGGKIDFDKTYNISEEDFDKINKRSKVDKWDVLISMIGTVGEVYLVEEEPDYAIKNLGLFKIGDELNSKWLYFYLKSKLGQNQIRFLLQGSTQQYISLTSLREFSIFVPNDDKEKQKVINILSALESKIKLNQKMNETLEEIAKILFKSWFIDFDPVRAKAEGRPTGLSKEISDLFPDSFEDSELGEIPSGWKVENIGNSFEVLLGGTPSRKKEEYWDGDIPWINSGEINNFRVIRPSEFISDKGFKNSSTKLLPKRSTLIAITGATLGQVSLNEIEVCANQSVIGIPPSKNVMPEYVYLWICFSIQKLISSQTGGAQQHINTNNVREHLILLPKAECNDYLKNLLTPVFNKISNNLFEIQTLSEIRETLLPKLISGELKIPDAENLVGEAGI